MWHVLMFPVPVCNCQASFMYRINKVCLIVYAYSCNLHFDCTCIVYGLNIYAEAFQFHLT